jgi:hypothetical protein
MLYFVMCALAAPPLNPPMPVELKAALLGFLVIAIVVYLVRGRFK